MKYLYKVVLVFFIYISNVSADDIVLLDKVNTWVNRNIEYIPDQVLYNTIDYWATPKETLKYLKGDCEDFVILKYFLLLQYGINKSDLLFMYNRINRGFLVQSHIVLVYKKNNLIVLDNTRNTLDSLSSRDDLTHRMFFKVDENSPRKLKIVLDKMHEQSLELK